MMDEDVLLRLRARRNFRLSPLVSYAKNDEFEMGQREATHLIAGQLVEKVGVVEKKAKVAVSSARDPDPTVGTYNRSDMRAQDNASSPDASTGYSNRAETQPTVGRKGPGRSH